MRTIFRACLLIFLVFITGCINEELLFYAAPTMLPRTEIPMKTAGFWIGRHPCPDRLIMDECGIESFNRGLCKAGLTNDIANYSLDPASLKAALADELCGFEKRELYTARGEPVPEEFFRSAARAGLNIEALDNETRTGYALVAVPTDQRLLPTDEPVYSSPRNRAFDELQNSALDIGIPLAVLHVSRDGAWYYVDCPGSRGWVKASDAALCTQAELKDYLFSSRFVVAVRPRSQLFYDPLCTRSAGSVQMGARLPIREESGKDVWQVILPEKKPDGTCVFTPAYVRRDEVHEGFLPYTPRTVITCAFAMLNAPYGWGGQYGEQDCSRLIQQVFAVTGLVLPRNSGEQAKTGVGLCVLPKGLGRDERMEQIVSCGVGGATLLAMKGHIMLYLGAVGGEPYAIHALWGYTERTWSGDRLRLVNRVAVSDLELGRDAGRGSFLERLTAVRFIGDLISCDPVR